MVRRQVRVSLPGTHGLNVVSRSLGDQKRNITILARQLHKRTFGQ
jgi:hypothetical protein